MKIRPPTRREALGASLAALGLPALLGNLPSPSERRLLVIFAEGGWDVTFALDPKLGVPGIDGPMVDVVPGDPDDVEQILEVGDDLRVQFNPKRRPAVGGLFEEFGQHLCVVNGVWVGALTHWDARLRVLTGTADRDAPDLATLVGVVNGVQDPIGALDFSGLARFGDYAARTSRFGRGGQLTMLLDPAERMRATRDEVYRGFTFDDADGDALRAYLSERAAADRRVGGDRTAKIQEDQIEALRRAEMLQGVYVPEGEALSMRSQLGVALQLLQDGSAHAAMLQTETSWDTHALAVNQHEVWNGLATDLAWLLGQMERNGLLDRITVAVLSDMSRMPTRNAYLGTDHWPHTSALLFGAGIAGGRTVGKTDDRLMGVPVDYATGDPTPSGEMIRPENVLAGLMEVLDVDPGDWIPGVEPLRGFQS